MMALLVFGLAKTSVAEEKIDLTFWYWAEPDAPGANDWMKETIKKYKKVKPNVSIDLVIQGTDALISSFQTAVSAGSGGPDIASQWAWPSARFCLARGSGSH